MAEMMLHTILPVRIISEANTRGHWRTSAGRKREHRAIGRLAFNGKPRPPASPLNIHLCRIAPKQLDDDNLASGFKALRDGIADWLGIDDGSKALKWHYAQRKGQPKQYAAEIVITWEA